MLRQHEQEKKQTTLCALLESVLMNRPL